MLTVDVDLNTVLWKLDGDTIGECVTHLELSQPCLIPHSIAPCTYGDVEVLVLGCCLAFKMFSFNQHHPAA